MKSFIAALLLALPGLALAQSDLAPRVERLECRDSGGMWENAVCSCSEGKEAILGQGCVTIVADPEPDPDPVDPAPTPAPPSYIPVESEEADREHYHKTANALWKNFGGDWIDKEGVPQGSEPFAQAGGVGEISLDISNMLDDWTGLLLRATGDYAEIWSLTGDHPPYLLADGQKIAPRAAVEVTESTYKNRAGEPRMQANRSGRVILLDFDIPEGTSGANLIVHQIRGRGELQVFRLDAPPFNPWLAKPIEYGIGKGKTIDELESNPDVIATWDYREGWQDKYPKAIDGVKQGPFFERANVGPVLGYQVDKYGETWVHTMFRGAEGDDDGPRSPHHVNLRFKPAPESIDLNETGGLDSVYFQYRVMTLFDVPTKEKEWTLDGGKWPGIDGRYGFINPANGGYWYSVTGNGGTPAPGIFYPEGTIIRGADYTGKPIMAGWSARGQWLLKPGPEGPLRDVASVGSYLYHPGWTYTGAGDTQMWDGVGLLPGVEYTIEHHIKINSVANPDEFGNGVGQPDGVHKIWVNGRLVRDVSDFIFTHNRYMNANGVWALFMHGGTKAPQVDQEFMVGPFVVAKQYIGPRFDEVVDPPVDPPVEPEPPSNPDPPVEPGVSPLTTMKSGELRELIKYECKSRANGHDTCATTWNSYGGWQIWEEGDALIQYSGAHSVTNVTAPDKFSLTPTIDPETGEPQWKWEYMFKPMSCEEVANGEALLAPDNLGYWVPDGDRKHPHAITRHSYDQVVIAPKGPDKVPHYFHFTVTSNPGHCKRYEAPSRTVPALPLVGEPIWTFSQPFGGEGMPQRGWDFNKPTEYDPVSGFIVTSKDRRLFWYDQDAEEIVASVYAEHMNLRPSANLVYFPETDMFYMFDGYALRVWEIIPNRDDLSKTTVEEIFPTGYGPVSSRVVDADTVNNVIGAYKDGIWHTLYPQERRWVAHQMPQNIGRVADHAGRFYKKAGAFMLHTGKEGTPQYTGFAWKPNLNATPLPEPPATVQ